MKDKSLFHIVIYPLLFLVALTTARTFFALLGIPFLPWYVDYSLTIIPFFFMCVISLLVFKKDHMAYSLEGAFLLSVINYPLNIILRFLVLGERGIFYLSGYIGDIIISVLLTLIFSQMLYMISEEMKFKILK